MADDKDQTRDAKRRSIRPRRSLPPTAAAPAQQASAEPLNTRVDRLEAELAQVARERARATDDAKAARAKADLLQRDVQKLERRLAEARTASLDLVCDRVNAVLASEHLPHKSRDEIAAALRAFDEPSSVVADDATLDRGWETTRPPAIRTPQAPPPPSVFVEPSATRSRTKTIGFENLIAPGSSPQPLPRMTPPAPPRARDVAVRTPTIVVPPPPPENPRGVKPGGGRT